MRLWMVENLTLDHVAAHMLQKHGFDRKRSQYEYILKKWKARKNIPSSSWSYASHAIEKRQAQQKKSQLQLNGLPILQSRMKRALQRNQPGLSLARKYGIAHSPERPDGCPIVMASPPALENSQVFWPKSLPWIQFDAGFHIALPISSKLLCSLAEVMSISGSKSISTVPRPMELARALFATSNPNQSSTWAADLIRMLPSLPNTSHESIISDLMEDPRKLSAYFLKSCLFQLSNKMLSSSYSEEQKNQYRSLLTLVFELRRLSATVFNALMAATDPTSKAIKETLYSAAVSWGNIDLIESLWRSGTDLNVLTSLELGNGEMHNLVRGKAALNSRYLPINQSTALQYAASTCDLPMATFLIEHGAKVDLGSPTPLQVLCYRPKHQDTLRFATLLLDKGARYDQQSFDWFLPPLMEAVSQNNRDLVEFLIQQGAQDTVIQVPPVESLADEGQSDFQLDPLPYVTGDYEYQVNVYGQVWEQKVTALQLAIVSNEIDILAMIIAAVLEQENRHEIFEEGFLTACLSGDEATVHRLLSLDAQILHNQNLVNWAFIAIAWIPDCRIAIHLLKHGAAPSEFITPSVSHLQMAALYGNVPLTKLLTSCGFDINSGEELQFEALDETDMDDRPDIRSPLECVVRMGHRVAAETLLELGADAGDVALKDFVELGSIILVHTALLCCEDIDGQFNEDLQDALDIAISGRKGREIVRQILDAGAFISGHNLVEAIRSSDEEVIQLLFARGADIFATGENGETVLEAAYQVGNMTMARHYFSCGGIYSSKALLHGVNRAVTMNLYHGFEDLLAKRPPGPVDEYEATGFVLSIRAADAFLINIFLGDAFRASSARSIYCWHAGLLLDSSMPEDEDQGLIITSNESWRGMKYHKCSSPLYVQRFKDRCLCSPMLLAALMAQDRLIRAMLDHGYQPDLLLIETMYNYKPATISYGVREMLMAACPMSSIKEPSWHRCLLLAAIKTSAGLETISLHLSILTCLDFYEIVDHQSYSPLQLAASIGDIDCVRTILEAGATVDWQASSGYSTALCCALDSSHWKIASLLIEAGANIDADTVFSDLLIGAATCGDLEKASFLLEHGLDINALSHGERALEKAAMNGRIDMAELLLSHGINIRGRQRIHFVRAVNFAIQGCHYATANLLKDHGGWDPEDSELARKPRATDRFHSCARFIYDDASLEGCRLCKRPAGCYPQSGSPEEVSNPASFIDCSVTQSREFSNAAQEIPGDDLFMLGDEFHFLQMTEWSFGPYTALDRERDEMARRMLEEYEEHMLEGTGWSLVPYTITEDNHNFEDSIMFEE
ncbi:hypothetical protein PFICI_09500 [Pestalotiopsis fici W106-1]|uniref:Clr5 domain-containing protein n=1 Tax=Pestalotiopsis fici (strain W106-1 / CGMCC3.15140) TaxID=1229662 RepID=W3X2M5_PESFW|nr:uncharacterized protein PFICI_09500 [Pestalotiopsis fici W106-1]ETS79647.1 hypothetical protein PFICI_09500 [Pestalotiopsis fici W106-1]